MRQLLQITTDRFCGGIETDNDVIVRAAPCFRWMYAKHIGHVWAHCRRCGWNILAIR